MLMALNIE